MTPLLALALVASQNSTPTSKPFEASPYVYKFKLGYKSTYAVKFAGRMGSQSAQIAETLTVEVLSVDADGSADLRFSATDVKKSGLAKDQPQGESVTTARATPYGTLSGVDANDPLTSVLSFMFSLPNAALAERTWTEYADPMAVIANGAPTEGTIRSRRGDQILFTVRTKATEGPNGTREMTFDAAAGRLISSKFRGGDGKTVPQIEVSVVRK